MGNGKWKIVNKGIYCPDLKVGDRKEKIIHSFSIRYNA